MRQKFIRGSLAMDLKRVSLGLQRGSLVVAEGFAGEAIMETSQNESRIYVVAYLDSRAKNATGRIEGF